MKGQGLMEFDEKKILVIDDDKEFLEYIVERLSEDIPDAEWITARDGEQGIRKFWRHLPKVVILDMMLPRRSGLLVLEEISRKTENQKSDKPNTIMITANEGIHHKAYAKGFGLFDYINKPFSFDRLLASVQDAMRR